MWGSRCMLRRSLVVDIVSSFHPEIWIRACPCSLPNSLSAIAGKKRTPNSMRRQEEGTTNARRGRSKTLATAWATSSGPGRYRLNCQEAVARCVELQRNYPEELSDDVNFNQAALSLPRKLAAVTRMEGEKEAMQCQALLFSLKGSASPCHTDTGLHIHPHVSASQGRGALTHPCQGSGLAASLAPRPWHEHHGSTPTEPQTPRDARIEPTALFPSTWISRSLSQVHIILEERRTPLFRIASQVARSSQGA